MANNGTAPDLQAIRDEITRVYNSTEDYTQQANMQPFNAGMTRDQIASIYYDGAVPSANDIPVLQPMNQQPIQAQTPTQKQNTPTTTQKPQKDVEMERAKEIGKQALKDAKSSVYGQGNIDLHNRPKYRQDDGSISTVNSMSFQDEDGKEVLIPTIAYDKNGKPTQLTDDEAIDRYYQTGEYLGKFNTVDEADKYAQKLHKDQEDYYLNGGNRRSLSANEQRDMERAMNARKEAEDRRKKTVTETVKTEEQLSGKMPSEITSGTVNKESEYDERGFRKNKAIFNEFLDPNKKLSQQEQQQAWDMINKYEQSENGAKNENATTLVFDEEHPDGISVPVYTVDENGNYGPSKELSQSDKDYRKNIYDLKAKVSNADATYNGLASGLVPFYEAGMRLTDYDGEWQKAQENSAKQNPLAYNASRLMGGLAASLTGQAALRGTKYADALGKLIGEGGVAKEILKDALSDMPIDLAVDILPSIAADIAAGKDANEVVKSALANIGLNAGLNTGAAVIGNAGDILTSLRPKSVLDDTLKNLEGADLFAEMANRGRNVETPAEGIDYFAQMASDKRAADAARSALNNELNPLEAAKNDIEITDISDEFAPMGDVPRLEEPNVNPMNGGGSGNSIVPRDTSRVDEPRGKVSQFATNTMKEGTNLTPEEYARNVDLADFTYENKSERQSMEDAFNMIREEGADNLKARLLSDDSKDLTQSEIDALMSITRTNNATARAMEAVGEDASAIRAETTAIYKKLRQQSTSNAQGLQALAKWTRNTPEGLLMHAENIVNGNTEAKGSALQEALKKLKKGKKDIDFSPEFEKNFLEEAEKLEDIGDMDSREAKDIMAKLGRMVNDEIPVKLNEKVQSFLMDNMLGNFRTLITRNAGGNLGLAGVEQVTTRPLAAGIDKAVSKVTGKRTQAGLSRDGIVEYLSGFRKGLSDEMHDVETGLHTARTGENTLENAIRSNRHVFKNKVQDKFDSLVKNGLSVGDRPFYEANYKQTLGDYYRLRDQGVMGNAVQNLSDDEFKMYAETAAKLNALASVYQNDSKISDALLGFKNAIGEFSEGTVGFDILSQFSMPFVKTPANVVDRAIDYSPLGIVRNIARTAKEGGLKGENFDQNRFVNETARNIIGTTLMGGAAAGAANGVMSGSYSDKNNVKQAQKDSGMQEYALNIPGGKQMDISWLPVVGSNAVAAAAAVDAYKDGDGNTAENLMKGLTAGGEALFDQSMFQGLQRLFGSGETYNSDSTLPENMINIVKSGFGQAIPSLVRQGAQVADRYQRDLGNSNKDLSFGIMDNYDINSLVNNIPGLRQNTLAPKVDLSGNLIEENQGRGLGSKILENMILPGKITDINVNPLDEEAIRLEEAGYDKAYRPKASRSTIDKGETPLTNEEWVSYEQRFGQEITNAGNAIINSDLYKNADDETKNSILSTSYDAIKNGINSEYTGSKVTGAAKAYVDAGGGEAGINAVLEYVEAKNNPYGISADTYSKIKESGEDLSQFNGYKEALEQYDIKDSEKLREAWTGGNFENEAQFEVTMNEQGLGDYGSKSAHDAYESGDLDKYKEYREYLKKKELSDSESRWADFKKGKIDTTASLNSDIDWSSYGITNKFADEGYAKAKQEIPKLSPQLYAQTYKTIDANGNNKFTQDEVINYLNRINADEAAAMQIWSGYGTSTWKQIPVLENGTWVKKSK